MISAMEDVSGYVLGLDLGVSSVGWAAIQDDSGRPAKILCSGVRIFEPGMEGDISSGRAESRNKKRRDARLVRRQIDRRKRRKQKLLHCLQKLNLLPAGEPPEFMPGARKTGVATHSVPPWKGIAAPPLVP